MQGCDVPVAGLHRGSITLRSPPPHLPTEKADLSDIDNFALLCPKHHTYLHNIGAHLRMGTDADTWKLVNDHTRNVIDQWTKPPPPWHQPRHARPPNQAA